MCYLLLFFATGVGTLSTVGCETSRTRPGVSETGGYFEWFAPEDQATTWDAAAAAADHLGYTVTGRSRPAEDPWKLTCRDAGANTITLLVEPVNLEATRVAVRIDPGRNESMSQLVLEAVRQQLAKK